MILDTNKFIHQKSLDKVKVSLLFLNFITSLFQIIISKFSLETLQILMIINISSLLTYNIAFNKNNLISNLIGSFMIIAFNIYFFLGPLLIKTFLIQQITSNLFLPVKSFTLAFFFQISVLLAFSTIIKIEKNNNNLDYKKSILYRLKAFSYFDLSSTIKFFVLLLSIKIYLNIIDRSGSITESGNIITKFLFGLEGFFYAPLIFYFSLYFYWNKISQKHFKIFLLINCVLFILFALLSNSRTQMAIGFFAILLNFVIVFMFSNDKDYKKNIKYFVIFILLLSIIFQGLSDILIKKRVLYDQVNPVDMLKFSMGINNFETPDEDISMGRDFEDYTGNGVLNRFTVIKYFDKTLFQSSSLSPNQIKEFKNFTYMKMLAFLPENLIRVFNKDYQKKKYFISSGSYIEQRSGFRMGGNFSKGSIFTDLILLTNSYLLSCLVLYILYLILFKIITIFQIRDKNYIIYSPLLILATYDFINFVNAGNFLSFFSLTIRMPIQYSIIYFLLNILLNKSQNKKSI